MVATHFISIQNFGLQSLLVILVAFPVKSQQTIQPPIPSEPETTTRENIPSFRKSLPGNAKLTGSVYVNSILENMIPPFFKKFLTPDFLDEYEQNIFANNVNETCKRDVIHICNMLVGLVVNSSLPEDYVLQMIDSWGKFPSGILSGHVAIPGDFEECINVHGKVSETEEIRGSYCLFSLWVDLEPYAAVMDQNRAGIAMGFRLEENTRGAVSPSKFRKLMYGGSSTGLYLPPRIGTCFPASCSWGDTDEMFRNVLRTLANGSVWGGPQSRQEKEKPPMEVRHFIMITILTVICGLCVFSTVFDLLVTTNQCDTDKANERKSMRALRSFSVYTNTRKLLNTSVGPDNFGCVHGLRFLSMAWVVLGHTWMSLEYTFLWNGFDYKQMYKSNWTLMAVLNSSVSVDTFFVLSGTLVAHGILKELDKTGQLNVPLLYVHRYFRLTPTYAIMIGITATILPYSGTAPNWQLVELEREYCQNHWWHNLLYINTIVSYGYLHYEGMMCCGQSWYLANDMVYFILSPLFVYPLWRWKRLGLLLLTTWFLQSVIHTCVLLAKNGMTPTMIYFMPDTFLYIDEVYLRPWTRAAPYTVVILLGYILRNLKKRPFPRLPKWSLWLTWTVSTGTALAIVFGPYRYFDPANVSEIGSRLCILYCTVHRPLWSFVIAWIIFACVSGYGGPVNAFLSWKPFIPLGRLSYCIYISSCSLQLVYALMNNHPVDYGVYHMVYLYLGTMASCIFMGFVLTVTIDSPFIQLEKIILEGLRKPPGKSSTFVEHGSEVSIMRELKS